jgi:hypothetical protein
MPCIPSAVQEVKSDALATKGAVESSRRQDAIVSLGIRVDRSTGALRSLVYSRRQELSSKELTHFHYVHDGRTAHPGTNRRMKVDALWSMKSARSGRYAVYIHFLLVSASGKSTRLGGKAPMPLTPDQTIDQRVEERTCRGTTIAHRAPAALHDVRSRLSATRFPDRRPCHEVLHANQALPTPITALYLRWTWVKSHGMAHCIFRIRDVSSSDLIAIIDARSWARIHDG